MMKRRWNWKGAWRSTLPWCHAVTVLAAGDGASAAGEDESSSPLLTLDRIFKEKAFEAERFGKVAWQSEERDSSVRKIPRVDEVRTLCCGSWTRMRRPSPPRPLT